MSARDCIANIVVAEISSVVNDSRVKVALTENGADAILSALDKAGYAVVPKEPTEAMRVNALNVLPPAFIGDKPLYEKVYVAMLAAAKETP